MSHALKKGLSVSDECNIHITAKQPLIVIHEILAGIDPIATIVSGIRIYVDYPGFIRLK